LPGNVKAHLSDDGEQRSESGCKRVGEKMGSGEAGKLGGWEAEKLRSWEVEKGQSAQGRFLKWEGGRRKAEISGCGFIY
jgi:hypothetical protein